MQQTLNKNSERLLRANRRFLSMADDILGGTLSQTVRRHLIYEIVAAPDPRRQRRRFGAEVQVAPSL